MGIEIYDFLEPKWGPLFGLEVWPCFGGDRGLKIEDVYRFQVIMRFRYFIYFFNFFGSKKAGLFDSSLGRTFSLRWFFSPWQWSPHQAYQGTPLQPFCTMQSFSKACCQKAGRLLLKVLSNSITWKLLMVWKMLLAAISWFDILNFPNFFFFGIPCLYPYRHPAISKLRWPVFLFFFSFLAWVQKNTCSPYTGMSKVWTGTQKVFVLYFSCPDVLFSASKEACAICLCSMDRKATKLRCLFFVGSLLPSFVPWKLKKLGRVFLFCSMDPAPFVLRKML